MDLIKDKIYKRLDPLNKNNNNKEKNTFNTEKNTFNTEIKAESKRRNTENI
jgi:hypothetical protein